MQEVILASTTMLSLVNEDDANDADDERDEEFTDSEDGDFYGEGVETSHENSSRNLNAVHHGGGDRAGFEDSNAKGTGTPSQPESSETYDEFKDCKCSM